MMDRDPMDALSAHYANSVLPTDDAMLQSVYAVRRGKRQRTQGLVGGFAVGALVAVAMLAWAARPIHANNSVSDAIARYQMINSGLAERATSSDEVAR